ncbi:MAG: hypothetical protein WCG85_18270, partial [Polyangia bacterium]
KPGAATPTPGFTVLDYPDDDSCVFEFSRHGETGRKMVSEENPQLRERDDEGFFVLACCENEKIDRRQTD